jgi:YidC/Oxa1 family membrane protein insertase
MPNFFTELAHFFRFFLKTQNKDIVFYSENKSYFPYLEGAIEEIVENHKKPVCYITSDKNDPILRTKNELIQTFYVKKLLSIFMTLVNSKIFVMTLTDLNNFHLRRSINKVHYVYIFHALVSTHMMYREGAFDNYDTIICCGPHHVKEIRKREKQENIKSKNIICGGYYRLEKIWDEFKKQNFLDKKDKKTILIAPSWGEQNIVKSCGKKLIETLLDKTNFRIILRPHPEITKSMPEILKEYEDIFGGNERFILERSIATNKSMLEADLLITDLSGIALEYAFGTERPVIFIDLPYKIKNKNFEKLKICPLELEIREKIGTVISPEKIDFIHEQIEKLLSSKKEKIIKLREEYVYNFGKSSKITADYIVYGASNYEKNNTA